MKASKPLRMLLIPMRAVQLKKLPLPKSPETSHLSQGDKTGERVPMHLERGKVRSLKRPNGWNHLCSRASHLLRSLKCFLCPRRIVMKTVRSPTISSIARNMGLTMWMMRLSIISDFRRLHMSTNRLILSSLSRSRILSSSKMRNLLPRLVADTPTKTN